uniref:Uncharacterized protein n=1 Tax=Lygus hesperus TaxID=30085 RepID=A0A0A9VUQ6_LYGHE
MLDLQISFYKATFCYCLVHTFQRRIFGVFIQFISAISIKKFSSSMFIVVRVAVTRSFKVLEIWGFWLKSCVRERKQSCQNHQEHLHGGWQEGAKVSSYDRSLSLQSDDYRK